MDQKEFDEILKKFLSGELSDEEEKIVEQWYSAIEDSASRLGLVEKFKLKAEMQRKLNAHKSASHSRRALVYAPLRPSQSLFFKISFAAATLSVILLVSYALLLRPSASGPDVRIAYETFKGEVVANSGISVKVLVLADGSNIALSPGSVIQIAESFNKTSREVFLKDGAAFFEITRDVSRPFLVYTDRVVAKVLGTSFRIDATKSDIIVAVKTGSVSVFPNNRSEAGTQPAQPAEVVLTPNQQAIYNSNLGKMTRLLVDEPLVLVSDEALKDLQFEATGVPVILDAMSKAYGVDITFDRELLSSCVLTTFINQDEGMFKRLEIICEAIGATYEVEGVMVKINSRGCVLKE